MGIVSPRSQRLASLTLTVTAILMVKQKIRERERERVTGVLAHKHHRCLQRLTKEVLTMRCRNWGVVVDDIGGEGTAFGLWNATKSRAGFLNADGKLGGVGIAGNGSRHDIWCETL